MPHYTRAVVTALCLMALAAGAAAQTPSGQPTPQKTPKAAQPARGGRSSSDALASERRAAAMQLANSLADEARGFRDEQLRARVQMRVADALWESDAVRARELFRRAWDSADSADKESARRYEEKLRAQAGGGAWAGSGPTELRAEVLRLAARRDRALGEEFLAKLTEAAKQETQDLTISANNAQVQPTADPEKPPLVVAQRLSLARRFLEEGDTERALQFADKALDIVTTRAMNFLSMLREKDQAAADRRFAAMLQRAAADPSSDAVIVSVLSSYAFTPFLTIVVRGDGRNHSSQERDRIVAPNISPELRSMFLAAAAQILLRPIPPVDQDRTLAGRRGLYFTIARLLPLFDQHAPNFSPELRAQMASLSTEVPENFRSGRDRMLTRGLVPEENTPDEGREAIEAGERAADPAERDASYARAAMVAARKGEPEARDLVDRIQDSDARKRARAYVDFTLVNRAIDQKNTEDALKFARTGELTNVHRVWALTEVARLLTKTEPKKALDVLDEATAEARRVGTSDPDHARALFGVATRMYELDRARAWDLAAEAVKAGNAATEFTGEDAQIYARFVMPRGGASTTNFTVDSFDVAGVFSLLSKDDLYRAIQLAKSFTGEAPRATATLSIVRTALGQKRGVSVVQDTNVAN